jgi:hypothetical protein
MTVLITLTTAGADSGPFDLYSDLDGYLAAFESGVSKAALEAGYASSLVPDYTNTIRVKSNGVYCTNYTNIPVGTTTTTTSSTTTTTTTIGPLVIEPASISSTSNSVNGCGEALDSICWIGTSNFGILSPGDIVYDDPSGVTTIVGTGQYYHIKLTAYPNYYSARVDNVGEIGPTVPIVCP